MTNNKNHDFVFFDEAHGQQRWSQTGFAPHTVEGIYKKLANFCTESLGLTVKTNTEPFSDDTLQEARIVVLPNPVGNLHNSLLWTPLPDTKLTTTECQNLWNYVAHGGRLLIMAHRHADEFTGANLNVLTQPFGFEFLPRVFINPSIGRMGESWAPITTRIESHDITKDVHVLCLEYCCPVIITNPDIALPLVWPPSQTVQVDLTGTSHKTEQEAAIAVSHFGSGRVVTIGSDVILSEELDAVTSDYHNIRLAHNILRFLDASDSGGSKPQFCPKVFLSHQSSDKPFARRLAHDLLNRGFDVWFDEFRLRIGDSLTESIDRAVTDADFFVLVISKAALASRWVTKEYAAANARMLEGSTVRILPVVIDECELPSFLKDLVWADFQQDYENALEDLAPVFHHTQIAVLILNNRSKTNRSLDKSKLKE